MAKPKQADDAPKKRARKKAAPQKKYKITWRCNGCNDVGTMFADEPSEAPDFCAKCERKIGRMRMEAAAKLPRKNAISHGGNFTRAMDMTADIVQKDFSMTDMRDDFRPGETCAPKLPPAQQARADSFFTRGKGAGRGMLPPNAAQMGQAAIRGAYARPAIDPIAAVHAAKQKMQVTEIFEKRK